MCLPWNHKWETTKRGVIDVEDKYSNDIIATKYILFQRCTHCGKEIVRKYRV